MAVLTATAASSAGVSIAGTAAASGGDSFANTGKEILVVRNAGGVSTCNVTLASPITVDGQAVADRTIAVPIGESRLIGPLKPGVYNDTGLSGGSVAISYDQVTSVFVSVLSAPPVG